MRIVYMGTPSFTVPSLKKIAQGGFEIILVVTQPDRPKGRGMKPTPPAAKLLAEELGIPLIQPVKIRDREALTLIQGLAPDIIVVVAYGQILPSQILDIPKFGCINLHASLLPELRGASPIQWAIILGKDLTGVTTMYIDEGMDTGDIILQREVKILDEETSGELSQRLSIIGADLLLETLRLIEEGRAPRRRQDGNYATYAPPIKKEDTIIDWKRRADEIYNLIRGLNPLPGAHTYLKGKRIKIYRSKVEGDDLKEPPGRIIIGKGKMVVACGKGSLSILELQPEGKRIMEIKEFLAGHRIEKGMGFEWR